MCIAQLAELFEVHFAVLAQVTIGTEQCYVFHRDVYASWRYKSLKLKESFLREEDKNQRRRCDKSAMARIVKGLEREPAIMQNVVVQRGHTRYLGAHRRTSISGSRLQYAVRYYVIRDIYDGSQVQQGTCVRGRRVVWSGTK